MLVSWIVWLRLVKLLAAALWTSGTVGALLPRDLADRQRAAYFLMGPGFGLSWAVGLLLLVARQMSPLSSWVLGAMLTSMLNLNVVLWTVGKDWRRGPIAATLAIASLLATFTLMVLRPS